MKELYIRPELEVELFETEDIITASDNIIDWDGDDWGNGDASTNTLTDGRY